MVVLIIAIAAVGILGIAVQSALAGVRTAETVGAGGELVQR
jgi:hypothetical protein